MAGKNIENKGSNGAVAIIFAAWAAVLLIAFFAYRGSDVGQLQNLAGNLGGGPLFGVTEFKDSLIGGVSAFLILFSWFGLGSFALWFIKVARAENYSHLFEIAISASVGAAIWSCVWFFLGLAGAYGKTAAVASVLIGLALGAWQVARSRNGLSERVAGERSNGLERVLIVLVGIPLILALIASMAPPTAKDTLLYHFALPKAFIAQGSNAFIAGNITSYLSLGAEMHNVSAMLLGSFVSQRAGEAAAGVTMFLFFPLLLLVIYGWARELKSERRWCLIAVLLVASVPTAYHVAASGYIDVALALYITLAMYAVGRWWKTLENAWLIFTAIFLGAALAIKLTTLFVIAAFALIILLRARQAKDGSGNVGRIIAGGFAALILAGVIASPWYLRTWRATGSPVFPFYMSIWKGEAEGWDTERSNLFQAMNSNYGGDDKNAADYIAAPVKLSIIAQPEHREYFDGVIGVAFLMGLPILVWALWKFEMPVEIKAGLGICGIMFLFWLFSSQQIRYLLPILPVLSIGVVYATEAVFKSSSRLAVQASLAAAAIAGILVSMAWFLQEAPLRVVLGGETRDEYLTRNLDYFPYYQWLNTETSADSRVWLINMRRDIYNLDRPYFSDYLFEDWTLRKMVWEARSVQELRAKTAAMGLKYVLVRHDFLFDYDKSTIVDDKKPRAENEAKLKIAKDFILDPANTIRSDNKFSLIKVFSKE